MVTPPPAHDGAAIAERLSDAQQALILALGAEWRRPKISPATTAHRDERLVERRGVASCNPYRLTPLGLAVRASLAQSKGEE